MNNGPWHLSGLARLISFVLVFSLLGVSQQTRQSEAHRQHHPPAPRNKKEPQAIPTEPKQETTSEKVEEKVIPLFDQNLVLLLKKVETTTTIKTEVKTEGKTEVKSAENSRIEYRFVRQTPISSKWCNQELMAEDRTHTSPTSLGKCDAPVTFIIKEETDKIRTNQTGAHGEDEVTIRWTGNHGEHYKAVSQKPYVVWVETSKWDPAHGEEPPLSTELPKTSAIETETTIYTDYVNEGRARWKYSSTFEIQPDSGCDELEVNGNRYKLPDPKAAMSVKVDDNILSIACFQFQQEAAAVTSRCDPKAKEPKCPDPLPPTKLVLVNQMAYAYTTEWPKVFEISFSGAEKDKLVPNANTLRSMIEDQHHVIVVNGIRLKASNLSWLKDAIKPPYHIDHYVDMNDCNLYAGSHYSVDMAPQERRPPRKANGILVGAAKIFDFHALQQMLNGTAAQLSAISGFDQASIVKAFGNIQGITRDTSFLTGQITTTQLPTIDKTITTDVSNAPAKDGTGTAKTTDNKTNTDVKSGGATGTVPSAPTASPLTPPSNVSVSAADILAEQVQLNAQITTLRLLLQGALSDRLLVKNNRAVSARGQTTLGFPITLNPPRQYKHAVAEVRIIVSPRSELDDPVSIVNLLPQEKTYNVAKVTSRQSQFGAGVVVEALNLGVSTGRAKDRLFLAKDTDTVALQYPFPLDPNPELGFWNKIGRGVRNAEIFRGEPVGDCRQVLQEVHPNSVMFGWQFRPVLGADYVQAGQRQVFAQLALPDNKDQPFLGSVIIQTLWRSYDPKKHVVGDILSLSCDSFPDHDAINLLTPIRIHTVNVFDLGNGLLQVDARGEFFAPGLNVLSGNAAFTPTNFDGKQITLFGAAKDLLQGDSLLVVGADGPPVQLATITNERLPDPATACGVQNDESKLEAEPRPDGNSTATLTLTYGRFDLDDHSPQVVIGNKIFGLSDAPFYRSDANAGGSACLHPMGEPLQCTYTFDAPTDLLNSTQVFAIKDLAWGKDYAFQGTISLRPTVDSLKFMPPELNTTPKTKRFLMSGKNVKQLFTNCGNNCPVALGVGDPVSLQAVALPVDSKDNVLITLPSDSVKDLDSIKIETRGNVFDVSLAGNLKLPDIVATPASLNIGDSVEVSFTWAKATPAQVKFEDTALIFSVAKKNLKVAVTTAVTKNAGQKQLRATMPDGSTVLLPLRVVGSGGGGGGN